MIFETLNALLARLKKFVETKKQAKLIKKLYKSRAVASNIQQLQTKTQNFYFKFFYQPKKLY